MGAGSRRGTGSAVEGAGQTMKFAANPRHWWTRGAAPHEHSLEGRCLPLLGLGGMILALIFSAWRFCPATEGVPGDERPRPVTPRRPTSINCRRSAFAFADAAGSLAAIACNGRPVNDVADLRREIPGVSSPAVADATVEAELDCDGNLRYEETPQIIAAISACPAADGRTMVPLVNRVKFAPRQGVRSSKGPKCRTPGQAHLRPAAFSRESAQTASSPSNGGSGDAR